MTPSLSVEKLNISIRKRHIVREVDVSIYPGQFCGLIGLNGSGKTTILNGICGLTPIYGTVSVNGEVINKFHEKKIARLISYVPQNPNMNLNISAIDVVNMGFNAQMGILEPVSKKQRLLASETLEKIGYGHLADRNFQELSQGQKQLVILARCIVQDTPVIVLDEPDSSLDYINKHKILSIIKELVKTEDKACLVTLHDPNFALKYCDRLILLKDGEKAGELELDSVSIAEVNERMAALYGDDFVLFTYNDRYVLL